MMKIGFKMTLTWSFRIEWSVCVKLLKVLGSFILAHIPRFLRWSADHIDDVVDDCDICVENGDYPCDDCPVKEDI